MPAIVADEMEMITRDIDTDARGTLIAFRNPDYVGTLRTVIAGNVPSMRMAWK